MYSVKIDFLSLLYLQLMPFYKISSLNQGGSNFLTLKLDFLLNELMVEHNLHLFVIFLYLFSWRKRGKGQNIVVEKIAVISQELSVLYPTKHLCSLVPAPFWDLISNSCLKWGRLCTFFSCYLGQKGGKTNVSQIPPLNQICPK